MEPFRIDEIAQRLFESVPPAFRSMQQDLEANFRSVLRSSLGKLDVVTREEFDTQMKVLERTRSKLDALEKKVGAGGAGRRPAVASGCSAASNPERPGTLLAHVHTASSRSDAVGFAACSARTSAAFLDSGTAVTASELAALSNIWTFPPRTAGRAASRGLLPSRSFQSSGEGHGRRPDHDSRAGGAACAAGARGSAPGQVGCHSSASWGPAATAVKESRSACSAL